MTASQSPLSQATDDRLSSMLFQGEEVEEEFTVESAHVVVSTHRVLVFTPDGDADGRRFDHADRPNVLDADVRTTGRDSYVEWGVRTGVYGAVLLGGGVLLKSSGVLEQLDAASPGAETPVTGVSQLLGLLPDLFGALTNVLLLCGGLLVLGAAALGALYASSRSRELVIERAGGDPIRVRLRNDEEGEQVARRLRTAVGTGSKSAGD